MTSILPELPPYLIALALAGGYLLGSAPFGLIVTRLGGAGDIRQIGSGNIGATNVLRTGRKDLAAVTLLADAGKGALAVALAGWLARASGPGGQSAAVALAGAAAFLGHLFPIWLKFRGGKGVAVFFGVLLAAAWPVGLLAGATWLAVAALFRFSSLAALAAAALSPLFAAATDQSAAVTLLCLAMGVMIVVRHHQNIRRLLNGSEPKIGAGKAPAKPA